MRPRARCQPSQLSLKQVSTLKSRKPSSPCLKMYPRNAIPNRAARLACEAACQLPGSLLEPLARRFKAGRGVRAPWCGFFEPRCWYALLGGLKGETGKRMLLLFFFSGGGGQPDKDIPCFGLFQKPWFGQSWDTNVGDLEENRRNMLMRGFPFAREVAGNIAQGASMPHMRGLVWFGFFTRTQMAPPWLS